MKFTVLSKYPVFVVFCVCAVLLLFVVVCCVFMVQLLIRVLVQDATDDGKDKATILNDDRVEVFLWPFPSTATSTATTTTAASTTTATATEDRYYCWEVNRACRPMDFSAKFIRNFDMKWSGHGKFEFFTAEQARALRKDSKEKHADTDKDKEKDKGKDTDTLTGFMTMRIPFSDLGLSASPTTATTAKTLRMGLYRGQTFPIADKQIDCIWTAWIDPMQEDVNFHCPQTFGVLELDSEIAKRV